jgi:hypothetical protein
LQAESLRYNEHKILNPKHIFHQMVHYVVVGTDGARLDMIEFYDVLFDLQYTSQQHDVVIH